MRPRSIVCDRVRAQISVELDGELSQLERAMLAAHVRRCAECRAYGVEVTAFTDELRAAELQVMERPVVVRRLRRAVAGRRWMQVPAAAALALTVVGVATQVAALGPRPAGQSASLGAPVRFPTRAELERELALIAMASGHGRGTGARETVR